MGSTSKIEWTDATWNPVRGCSMAKGSELGGCLNCYAAAQAVRFAGEGGPFDLFARRTENGPRWTGKVELVEKHLGDPLRWRAPKRVFVNSMSDLFHEALPDEAIDRVFAVMALSPQHTFQILTKRAERMQRLLSAQRPPVEIADMWPMKNVWLGVSVENQATADERIPLLLQTPAAVRFVSYEPALGPINLETLGLCRDHRDGTPQALPRLHWVIVGGESGPGARPFWIDWARNTIAQCKAAGVACFVKQVGRFPNGSGFPDGFDYRERDRKGGTMEEWPADIRVREFPAPVEAR